MSIVKVWRSGLGWFFGVVGLVAIGYAVFLLVSGRQDEGDKVSSVVSASIGLCSLAVSGVSLYLQLRSHASPEVTAARLARRVAAQWRDELVVRGIDRPLVTRWSVLAAPSGSGAGRVLRFRAQGDITDVERRWRELTEPRLVVLGEPGAGKTSLVITLVAALAREHVAGMPVPVLLNLAAWRTDSLQDWMDAEIARQYQLPSKAVRSLFAHGWLLPVLDGLDEVPVERGPMALEALSRWAGTDRACVVTCRTTEFEQAVEKLGERLNFAAVVEMVPISPADVATYLTTNSSSSERWRPVIDHVTARPDSPLARSLTTPLMAYLTRTAYREPSTDPAHLVTLGSSRAIEAHLFNSYLPAVYGPRPWATAGPRYTARQAHRWLTTIATLSRYVAFQRGTPTSGRAVFGRLAVSLLLSALGVKFLMGFSAADTLGVIGLVVISFTLASALVGRISWGAMRWAHLGIFVVVMVLWSWWQLIGWAAVTILVYVVPVSRRGDTLVVVVALLMLWGGLLIEDDGWRLVVGVLLTITLLISVQMLVSPWVVHLWPVVAGRLPLRVDTFLRDAHARGVLRRSGDGYRLRHEQLRRYLA